MDTLKFDGFEGFHRVPPHWPFLTNGSAPDLRAQAERRWPWRFEFFFVTALPEVHVDTFAGPFFPIQPQSTELPATTESVSCREAAPTRGHKSRTVDCSFHVCRVCVSIHTWSGEGCDMSRATIPRTGQAPISFKTSISGGVARRRSVRRLRWWVVRATWYLLSLMLPFLLYRFSIGLRASIAHESSLSLFP